ncbi:hypothetical protein AAC387_Pa03g2169 [Persea americana]
MLLNPLPGVASASAAAEFCESRMGIITGHTGNHGCSSEYLASLAFPVASSAVCVCFLIAEWDPVDLVGLVDLDRAGALDLEVLQVLVDLALVVYVASYLHASTFCAVAACYRRAVAHCLVGQVGQVGQGGLVHFEVGLRTQ